MKRYGKAAESAAIEASRGADRCTARSTFGTRCQLPAGHRSNHIAKQDAGADGWSSEERWKRRDVVPIAEGSGVFHCGECGATNRVDERADKA